MIRRLRCLGRFAACALLAGLALPSSARAAGESAISDEVLPLQVEKAPPRPKPLVELGADFLGTGTIGPGFRIPTGAWWQPQLLVWGNARSAVQVFDRLNVTDQRSLEWVSRLDLFAELEVSPTERIVLGLRPLDDSGRFTGRRWEPDAGDGWINEFNNDVELLFAEVNLGELFPALDRDESRALDFELSVGRQPLLFQDGFLINDSVDSVALTRNNITLPHTTNTRLTGVYGWGDIDRATNMEDRDARLFALLVETDVPSSTLNLDLAYVDSTDRGGGDALFAALSSIQRIGHYNTLFRVATSKALDGDRPQASGGTLIYGEVSWTPAYTHNIAYVNAFAGINEFDSAARGPATGGPLGTTGLLFGAVGLGAYGAPLGNSPDNSVGGALGYQMFFAHKRRQLVLELGGRQDTNGASSSAAGVATRFQQAFGQRLIARFDGFWIHTEGFDGGYGLRTEIVIKF